ncbi:hypothetical protein [Candidatus Parabeggiatoa sp. HSG14]|uniref:hypothetical protein n=1 Tax=Candidatus Parabeggiatoa sp. HSG14 TaxID=3055593 RepID=UPI0025A82528|nr:hypothetical protein [Thiotrichales bacterium HSG14]
MELLFAGSLLIFVLTVLVMGLMKGPSSNAFFTFNQNEFSQAGVVISFLDGTIKIDGKKYDVNDVKTIDSWSSFGCSSPRSVSTYYAYIETKNLNNDSKHKKVFTSIDNVEKFIKKFNFSLEKVKEYPQGQTYDYISKENYTFSNCYETVEKTDKTLGLDETGEIEKNRYRPSQAEIDEIEEKDENYSGLDQFLLFIVFLFFFTAVGFMLFRDIYFILTLSLPGAIILSFLLKP